MKTPVFLVTSLLLLALASSGLYIHHEPPAPQITLDLQSTNPEEDTLYTAYSEAIGRNDAAYHFRRNGAGYAATNPVHKLIINIADDLLSISVDDVSWQLVSKQTATDISAKANRLTLHREGYDEWYVNSPSGFQQGFTLYEPSEITFDIGGTLTTSANTRSLSIGDDLTFAGLMAYDANNNTVPVEFNLKDDRLVYVYDDRDATYPLTIDPWVQQAKLIAADWQADDFFGRSLAIDGDTALIGAFGDDDHGANSGSVYVFTRSGSTWSQQQKFTPVDVVSRDRFGKSVAIDGDSAVIGAPGHNGDRGSAFIYTRSGSTWTQQGKLIAADWEPDEAFGESVAIDGDTALIGAYHDTDNGTYSGSAYVFTRIGSTWSQQQKLLPADGGPAERFGWSVAVSGDTALISAPLDNDSGASSGSAYVFTRSGSTWSEQQKLIANDADRGDNFGESVALEGDTALIGAFYDEGNNIQSGSAYVFTRSGSTWSQQAKLLAADGDYSDYFGGAVALSGDTAFIGATGDSANGTRSGSAYVFTRSGSTWTQQQKLLPDDGSTFGAFARSVSLSGNTALIGENEKAYVFFFTTPPVVSATCNAENLEVTISAGDGPFDITASAGINTPVTGVGIGATIINGPEKWDNLTVTETSEDFGSINLGQFKCRTGERPIPQWPPHRYRTTNPHPYFSWTPISDANNYRVFLFDDPTPALRTVDIRQNSGGPTTLTLAESLIPGRYFWRVRGRQNRVWSLWSIRFTLFRDPAPIINVNKPMPTIELNTSRSGDSAPNPAPTVPVPPNSR